MTPIDAAAREQALDPLDSFCVSAPAGSGKTGLLVKRFLGLLARVEEPERVVAITFTRKAAAEMRARVVAALHRATDTAPAANDHEQALLDLAIAVREHDRRRAWGLMANPSRLRIQTIDSFCGHLTRQMPVLSGSGGQVSATDNSEPLYRLAIESFLHSELSTRNRDARRDIETLLLHLDNNWDTAVELLARLLQRREQWQPVFGGAGLGERERRGLLEITESLVSYRLAVLRDHLGTYLAELTDLMAFRAAQLGTHDSFDPANDGLRSWKSLGQMLLTNGGDWRKRVNKNDGFPPGTGVAKEMKARLMDLLAIFSEDSESALLEDLRQLAYLPDVSGEPEHWAVLAALTRLLPRLGAQLLLVFQQRGEVDHAQIAMAALTALGEDDAPTDIALRLDHTIEHLLVDEFQDTSSVQYELIRRLTRGWAEHNEQNPEAPHTLLLVGDAMQSIYGFREANVGLFIAARESGIGDLALTAVDLSVNFRSQGALVEWSNNQFAGAFPVTDDAQMGAVSFRAANSSRAPAVQPEIALFTGEGAASAELQALCERLGEGVADSSVTSIAILGRSRTQLRPVLAALREHGIEASARDMDVLEQRPVIRDLVTLCGVLSNRFSRYAWLSLLRCPAAALSNADLLLMAQHAPTAADVLQPVFPESRAFAALSIEGQARLRVLLGLLHFAEHYRDRLALRVWVEECWLRLGGAASLSTAADVQDAEQFFQCLEQLEQKQRGFNARVLDDAVRALFASPGDERCKVQVMTLHKAKGLEFDWVFIPALGKSTGGQDRELLLWDEFTLPGQAPAFLLDIRSGLDSDEEGPRLYDYLKAQAQQKRRYESTRLFYVGCTRAADFLWLGGTLTWDEKREQARAPSAGSLLSSIWPSISDTAAVQHVVPDEDETVGTGAGNYRRLRDVVPLEIPSQEPRAQAAAVPDNVQARAFGTAMHRCLESLVYRRELPAVCDATLRNLLRVTLVDTGADSQALATLCEQGEAMLTRVITEPWLGWSLSGDRPERHVELPLTAVIDGEPQVLIIDYTFLDEARGERWVVDYKTAAPRDDESEDAFVAGQLERYAAQLRSYRDAMALKYPEPIRCALYFTALGRYAEWRGDS